jgi:hypothetical protein
VAPECEAAWNRLPVCTENVIRIDWLRESPNVVARSLLFCLAIWPYHSSEQAPCRCCQRFANEIRKPNENKRDQSSSDSSGFTGFFRFRCSLITALVEGWEIAIRMATKGTREESTVASSVAARRPDAATATSCDMYCPGMDAYT